MVIRNRRNTDRRDPTIRRLARAGLLAAILALAGPVSAQTFTMNKQCRADVAAAAALNDGGNHPAALSAFDALVEECKTKDAKEAIQTGRARALNGLGRYDEAVTAADAALEVTKDQSLFAYFERAYAREQQGQLDAAKADYDRIIELTEKNQNVAERATIYAKVADMNQRAGKTTEAQSYLATARELDPDNADLEILQGDWAVRDGNYDAAFAAYDRAVAMGRTDAGMYQIRSEARLKQFQDQYGTTNAQELRRQMTPAETELVCAETGRALELGLQNMQLDMFTALVCR